MATEHEIHSWDRLHHLLGEATRRDLEAFVASLAPSELAHAVSRLGPEDQERLLTRLAPDDAAGVVEQLPDAQVAGIIERLAPGEAAMIVQQLSSDGAADLIGELADEQAAAILAEMPASNADEVRELAAYPPDVAGGLMSKELLAYRDDLTVANVVDDMRQRADDYADYSVQYAYVTSRDGRLVGVLRLRDLLLARGGRGIASLMIPNPLHLLDTANLDELRDFFDSHDFLGVPVVDAMGRLHGVVQKSMVDAALGVRSDLDYLKAQGIVGGEELRGMPTLLRARRRLSWLSVNVLLNIAAASVIAAYQDTLEAAIALAVFLPIISDMSGCSGNQAVAVSMRELTLGLIDPGEVLRVLRKELTVGAINGLVLGLLIAAAAWLWKGNTYLGLVVGAALALNTMIAVSIGGTVPLVLRRFGFDPALASGPVLTTITDVCGFFMTLSFASLCLARLA